jgi:hypothetical protein
MIIPAGSAGLTEESYPPGHGIVMPILRVAFNQQL